MITALALVRNSLPCVLRLETAPGGSAGGGGARGRRARTDFAENIDGLALSLASAQPVSLIHVRAALGRLAIPQREIVLGEAGDEPVGVAGHHVDFNQMSGGMKNSRRLRGSAHCVKNTGNKERLAHVLVSQYSLSRLMLDYNWNRGWNGDAHRSGRAGGRVLHHDVRQARPLVLGQRLRHYQSRCAPRLKIGVGEAEG